MSKESMSTIIQLKDKLLTEKYKELHTATSQQKTMKVFFWGGFVFVFIGLLMKDGMSTSIEVIWIIAALCSTMYGVTNMPSDDMLQRMKDKIAILELEIKQLKETEK